jgi:hypothetical protein
VDPDDTESPIFVFDAAGNKFHFLEDIDSINNDFPMIPVVRLIFILLEVVDQESFRDFTCLRIDKGHTWTTCITSSLRLSFGPLHRIVLPACVGPEIPEFSVVLSGV